MASIRKRVSALWIGHAGRFLRYSGISAFNVLFGQGLLIFFRLQLGFTGWVANVLAVTVGSIPAFFLNKRYVWRNQGRMKVRTELVPFLSVNGLGLLVSTSAVKFAEHTWGNQIAVSAASLTAWGTLWVLKYVFFDRVLFNKATGASPFPHVIRSSDSVGPT